MLQLILGGARSGKSRLAEQIAINTQLVVTYVATAQALDSEMQSRMNTIKISVLLTGLWLKNHYI